MNDGAWNVNVEQILLNSSVEDARTFPVSLWESGVGILLAFECEYKQVP